jgi:hypothetical protein
MTITITLTNGQLRAIPDVWRFNCDGDDFTIVKTREKESETFHLEDVAEITIN